MKERNFTRLMLTVVVLLTGLFANAQQPVNIIPQPLKVTTQQGKFILNGATKIYVDNAALKPTGAKLAAEIKIFAD